MGKTRKIDVSWPNEQQELLLKAALMKGPESILAWEKWMACTDVDSIDLGSQRLFPLLYKNLRSQDVSHPVLNQYKDFYRKTWCRNQMVLNEMAGIVRALHEGGIETILLKGTALILMNYKDAGLRPMSDVDILIRSRELIPIIHTIQENNIMIPAFGMDKISDYHISNTKHYQYLTRSGYHVELHHHILFETRDRDADLNFWEGSIPIRIGTVPTRALNPADQLLHVCVHGLAWNNTPPLRWAADAYWILQTSPDIDWERLSLQAKNFDVTQTMKEALQYLSNLVAAPIPAHILARLDQIPVPGRDRMEFHQYNNSPNTKEKTSLTQLMVTLWNFHKFNSPKTRSWLRRVWDFPRFLQFYWNLDHLGEVARVMVRKILKIKR